MKRLLSIFLAAALLLSVVPSQAFAEGTEGEQNVSYPLTIKVYNLADKKLEDKTFNSPDDKLGQWYKNAGRSDWSYRTFRKIFLGWSTDKKFLQADSTHNMDPNEVIYRDIESISAIEGLNKDTELYPVIMPVTDLMAFAKMLETGGGTLYINGEKTVKDVEDEATEKDNFIKRTEGFEDIDAEKRLIEYYFDPDKEGYEIQAVSEFYFKDPRVPFVIVENPLGIIKSAKGVTDFTGENPQNYSYEDLTVELDNKFEVAKQQEDWTFESSTFIVSDVLDENYKSLSPTIALPNPDSLVTKFSFKNPNGLKKFIIRTTPRSDNSDAKYGSDTSYPTDNTTVVTGQQILQPMKLKTGKGSNIKISKEYAKELEADKELESVSKGKIKGAVGIDKRRMTGGAAIFALILPDSQAIPELKAKNTMNFDFAIPIVRFDKNTKSLGDAEEQNLGYSKFVVNKAMNSDGFDQDTQPNKDITQAGEAFISDKDYKVDETKLAFNGKEYTFKGWNTQADGKGEFVKADTVIKPDFLNQKDNDRVDEDMVLYAIWEAKEEPKPEPKPDTGHQGGSKGGATTTPSKPEPKPEEPDNGDLNKADHYQYLIGYPDGTFAPNKGMTRAEVATMFTRLLKDRPVKGQSYAAGLSDIYAGDWYADTVGYAVQKGIVSGYPDGTFKPNQPITRAEFSSIASRFADLTEEKDLTFSDLDASHWGYKAIRLAASNGWISGYPDNTFRPEQAITRAEVTSITNRMLNRSADLDWINAHNDEVIHFSDVSAGDWFFEPVMEATMGHDFTRDKDGKAEHWTDLNGKTFI
ncbi:S-layer homology domain-containing protein [Peptococcus niger]|uniref:Listeria/Bacterioides repeat-containing protein n=1 Tax=Peptococcus niger TaxID=2741 RepID=A0A1G6WE93_PEPNI|nr:S-layer homology domain-containing protein [Peptococcus niger]SDD64260.1 Listeria/Bacterioides repeat-containing protein [Peptococcus niger]